MEKKEDNFDDDFDDGIYAVPRPKRCRNTAYAELHSRWRNIR